MFKKNAVNISEKIDTLIGKNSTFEGTLNADGTVRIDGGFTGDVHVKGDIIVGEEGKILGNVTAHNVIISGMVDGNIIASNQLKLNTSGKVFGDIQVASLVIEENAIFDGKCKMKDVKSSKSTDNTTKSNLKTVKA